MLSGNYAFRYPWALLYLAFLEVRAIGYRASIQPLLLVFQGYVSELGVIQIPC